MSLDSSENTRRLITLRGSVQGVGFRPFVYRLAHQYHLFGDIQNTSEGVFIDIQGSKTALSHFQKDLKFKKPERAQISEITFEEAPLRKVENFEIKSSLESSDTSLALLPDSAMCQECLQELSDPKNRRYRYPFLHCMTCGPRFSLFLRMPFDRENTTMADFVMCDLCRSEYADPSDRRFYSQTNCCPKCGPTLQMFDSHQKLLTQDLEAIQFAAMHVLKGNIVAVKNTGGFLLLADATQEHAVKKLRMHKQRAQKPFAILAPSLSYAETIAYIGPEEKRILTSPAGPIVLLNKKPGPHEITPLVSEQSPYYGIMLPHNALQYLLLEAVKKPLVATSGNLSGKALCITEEEAFAQLSQVADVFLVHNRRIQHRLDDSIVHIIEGRPMILRRARGYIPHELVLPEHVECALASGGHLKNSFVLAKKDKAYMSQHIGNLDATDTCQAYDLEVKSWESLLNISPDLGICDLHPDYYTSHYLQRRSLNTTTIQHHEAHIYSCMLDNQIEPPLLGFSWDGTGLGHDHTIWGGETFIVREDRIQHFASLLPFPLPGAEKAIKEPRRSALGVLYTLLGPDIPLPYPMWLEEAFSQEELAILTTALNKGIQSPVCSSMGRLFDAVSALLGCCMISDYEGHAALALENLARKSTNPVSRYTISLSQENDLWRMDWRNLIQEVFEDKIKGIDLADIAISFHLSLVQVIVSLASKASLEHVLLTGGVMQNKLLAEKAIYALKQEGFQPHWNHEIPPNDGGLAAGQIMGHIYSKKRSAVCV